MKNNIKIVIAFILGGIILGGIGVYAGSQILASDVDYKDGKKVSQALDDLYSKVNNTSYVCILTSGTANQVGSKYACELGDGVARNFYILKVNTDDVELIMERNISDTVGSNTTMNWDDAIHFFDTGHPGATLKQTWLTKVKEVKLPDATTIATAGGIAGFDITQISSVNYYFGGSTSTRGSYLWLWDYARECSTYGCSNSLSSSYAYGYWSSTPNNNSLYAWSVSQEGSFYNHMDVEDANIRGVRPVIVLSKTNLAG